jgi:hypothetical protein
VYSYSSTTKKRSDQFPGCGMGMLIEMFATVEEPDMKTEPRYSGITGGESLPRSWARQPTDT